MKGFNIHKVSSLLLLGFCLIATANQVQANPEKPVNPADMPQDLWQAFNQARLQIEPVSSTESTDQYKGFNANSKLRFQFGSEGVSIQSTQKEKTWDLGMRLTTYGDQKLLLNGIKHQGNQVTFDRGRVQEWYINQPQGLEQGFTLAAPPETDLPNGEVTLELELSGDLTPNWKEQSQSIAFHTQQGKYAFTYNKLKVIDAKGKSIAAQLAFLDKKLQIRFSPGEAQWPITVDPLIATETKLIGVSSDAASDDFYGSSIALDGDTALIGAAGNDTGGGNAGIVYVMHHSLAGWITEAVLSPTGGLNQFDNFGKAVALSGNTALVGVPNDDTGASNAGAAFVFTRAGTTWTQQAKLTPTTPASNNYFGYSVALDGDTALIGAYGNFSETGIAHTFTRSGAVWTNEDSFYPADWVSGDQFGYSVALEGDTAVIGAQYGDSSSVTDCGSAYIFTRTAGTWSELTELIAPNAAASDRFGSAVALKGADILIGAYFGDGGGANSGSAYVYTESSGVWSYQDELFSIGTPSFDRFAYSVAISGDTALIGNYVDDDSAPSAGSAHIFTRSAGVWSEQYKFTAYDAAATDLYGIAVALDGTTAFIGAQYGDTETVDDSGAAYVYSGTGSSWSLDQKITATDAAAGDEFGGAVTLNGDTALIGAFFENEGGSQSGSAYVFTRSGSGWSQQAKLTASDAAVGDRFGASVALGEDSALIGAPLKDEGGLFDSGSAYMFARSGSTWSQQQKLTASDASDASEFGSSVALDGDSALIGASGEEHAGILSGAAYVFTRSGSSWSEQTKLTASDAAAGDLFGLSVALSADTALVGARWDDDDGFQSGSAYVFTRLGSIWSPQAKLTASDAAAGDNFGSSVALDGETSLIGAWHDSDGGSDSGSAYVFTRSGSTWNEQQKLTASDAAADHLFGSSVALAQDVALIGAHGDDDGGPNSGSAYVFTRSGSAWGEQHKLSASDVADNDEFGLSVALDGDTTLIGAYKDDDAGTDSGSAYINRFECGFTGAIVPNRWTMIGTPCNLGGLDTVQDVFSDNLVPAEYQSTWVVYRRDEATDRYILMGLSSQMVQGEAYWLYSQKHGYWDANGSLTTYISSGNCASAKGCFEVPLVVADSAGNDRYNMVGNPVNITTDWASVRVLVDGMLYTPGDADFNDYLSKTIWKYNGNGYDAYDPDTPGMVGEMKSHEGFWVLPKDSAVGKTVSLLIPHGPSVGGPPAPPGM